MNIDCFSFTHTGGRENNEDYVGKLESVDGGLYVVADGLGGHLHGEQASAHAVASILVSFDWEEAPCNALHKALLQANEDILTLQKESQSKMKSTVVCLLIQQSHAFWAHIGDSRLYYLHNGEIVQITADHSVAYKKYLSGEISWSQIATDEDQSSLLRALGTPNRSAEDIGSSGSPLSNGDGFLLCTDGLWEYLHNQEIAADLLKSETAQQWAQLLLLRVMERAKPGNDNLSLIALRIND